MRLASSDGEVYEGFKCCAGGALLSLCIKNICISMGQCKNGSPAAQLIAVEFFLAL